MRKRNKEREFAPIVFSRQRRVRFEEVDQIRFMWHGRYASWLEDGREALGREYGISYLTFYDNNVAIPLKTFNLEFFAPLLYNEIYTIESSLLWNEACVLEFDYRILDLDGNVMTKGNTIQLMIDLQGKLLIEAPQFYKDFCKNWKENQSKTQGNLE